MAEIVQEYRDRLSLSIGMARAAVEAPSAGVDADRAFSVLAAACKTAEFLGLRAVIPPAHALESARAAAGPRVADWDAAARARVVSALDGLDLAIATLAPSSPPVREPEPPPLREFETVAEPTPVATDMPASPPDDETTPAMPLEASPPADGSESPAQEPERPVEPLPSAAVRKDEALAAVPEVVPIPVDRISTDDRLRPPNPGAIRALAKSMTEIGLCAPITVVLDGQGAWILVSGLQRLCAARELGWTHIPTFVMTPEGITSELWKIDENLMRAELTRLERDQHLLRRKEIYEATRAAETGRDAPSLGGRGKTGFARETEAELGLSKRSVNEAIHRASRIPTQVQERLKGTAAADSAIELKALARLDPKQQMEAVERVSAGRAQTLRQAAAQLRGRARQRDPSEFQFQRLVLAWNSARPEIRTRFLRWLVATGALHEIPRADAQDEGTSAPGPTPRLTPPV